MTTRVDHLGEVVADRRAGRPVGITSVCSAHPLVLAAAVREAADAETFLLVEATSNQVDQFGGYTGLLPADFRDLVHTVADEEGFPRDRIVLGGDHLGPNRWRDEPEDTAMAKSEDLVRAYVAAGFTKLHLDCTMTLAGDAGAPTDEVVAARATRMLAAAEDQPRAADGPPIRYVIGTEVPVPGGAGETIEALTATPADAARATVAAHRRAFERAGLGAVWPRIMALVVQPGVEFDHARVIDYDPAATAALQHAIDDEPGMVFEAHSTDYQTTRALSALVEGDWAVLKVGPGLTFALREGLFALAAIEDQLVAPELRSDLLAVLEEVMLAEPDQWSRYYHGDEAEQRVLRRFSYSDRVRYYLPHPRVVAAVDRLVENLSAAGIPEPLLSQYLPAQYARVRSGALAADPRELLIDRVRDALRPYTVATGALEVPAGAVA